MEVSTGGGRHWPRLTQGRKGNSWGSGDMDICTQLCSLMSQAQAIPPCWPLLQEDGQTWRSSLPTCARPVVSTTAASGACAWPRPRSPRELERTEGQQRGSSGSHREVVCPQSSLESAAESLMLVPHHLTQDSELSYPPGPQNDHRAAHAQPQ